MRSVTPKLRLDLGDSTERRVAQPVAKKATWLSRAQVARRLGCPYHRVRTMEGRWLHPKREGRRLMFDPEEVEAAREQARVRPVRSADGELAARAAELFASGKTIADVVVLLRVTPGRLRELRRELAEPEDLIVPGSIVAAIQEMGFAGTGPQGRLRAEDLPQVIARLLAAARKVASQGRPPSAGRG